MLTKALSKLMEASLYAEWFKRKVEVNFEMRCLKCKGNLAQEVQNAASWLS